jgi:hypothetical protein
MPAYWPGLLDGNNATVADTVAKPLDGARRTWTTLEYRPSPRLVTDGPGRCAYSYGSEGRARHLADEADDPAMPLTCH